MAACYDRHSPHVYAHQQDPPRQRSRNAAAKAPCRPPQPPLVAPYCLVGSGRSVVREHIDEAPTARVQRETQRALWSTALIDPIASRRKKRPERSPLCMIC